MLNIKCPYCGERAQKEFAYGGDGTIKRPELNKSVTDKEWDAFVYERKKSKRQTYRVLASYFWM
jgi:sarcosine oxidase subunit delta